MRIVTWSRWAETPSMAWGSTARRRCTAGWVSGSICCNGGIGGISFPPQAGVCTRRPHGGRVHAGLLGDGVLLDLLLQLHDAEEDGFGDRGAAGDVNIDRHDLVDALH